MWEMSRGPSDLGHVSWIFYPFAADLAALVVYIIVYLAQLTGAPQSSLLPMERLGLLDGLMRALYTYEWHPRRRRNRPTMWP